MTHATRKQDVSEIERANIVGRGLRARRGGVRLTLRALREAVGKTQKELSDLSAIDQADISRLEGRESYDDCQVSTLQRYVAALGGTLELVANFGDKKIIVAGVHVSPNEKKRANKPLQATGRQASRR